jgi:amidase
MAKPVRRALEETAELLGSLGHRVIHRDPPTRAAYFHATPRFLRGISDDVEQLARPNRLERRSRQMARLGRMVSAGLMRRGEETIAGRSPALADFFRDTDVLLTPSIPLLPLAVGAYEGCGWARTANGNAAYSHFTAPWNATGQPGVAVPAGFTDDGLPLSVQLVGRAHDEATLISLAAQLEAERPWADRRPAIAA